MDSQKSEIQENRCSTNKDKTTVINDRRWTFIFYGCFVSKWFQDKKQIVWHCKIWFGDAERIFKQTTAGTLGCRVLPQFTTGGAFQVILTVTSYSCTIWPLNCIKKIQPNLEGRLKFNLFSCVLFQSAGIAIFLWLLPVYQIPRQFLSVMYKTVWYNLSGEESHTSIVIILGLFCNCLVPFTCTNCYYFENSSIIIGKKWLQYLARKCWSIWYIGRRW